MEKNRARWEIEFFRVQKYNVVTLKPKMKNKNRTGGCKMRKVLQKRHWQV